MNDADGLLCNAWRALRADPDGTAFAADWPVSELDLHARHLALLARRDDLTARLGADPEYFDTRLAGWWIWGACCWIGSGWCSGEGPWVAEGGRLVKRAGGRGVSRKIPLLQHDGVGVNKPGVWRQSPHLHGIGQGIHKPGISRQVPHLTNNGQGIHAPEADGLTGWFSRLSARLRNVRVVCGDWKRVTGPSVTYKHLACRDRGACGVFLDPPYSAEVRAKVYSVGDDGARDFAAEVRAWCVEHDAIENLRIVLAGFAGEGHEELETRGWRCVPWWRDGYLAGGYAKQGDDGTQAHRERLWISPACLDVADPAPDRQLALFGT